MNKWLRDPNFVKAAEEGAYTDSGTTIQFEIPMTGAEIALPHGHRSPTHSIQGEAKCRKEETTIELTKAVYGEAAVTLGRGSSFSKPVKVVVAQRPGEQAKMLMKIHGAKLAQGNRDDDEVEGG